MTVLWRWRWISASSWFHSLSCAGPFISRPNNWICCTLEEKSKDYAVNSNFKQPIFPAHPRNRFPWQHDKLNKTWALCTYQGLPPSHSVKCTVFYGWIRIWFTPSVIQILGLLYIIYYYILHNSPAHPFDQVSSLFVYWRDKKGETMFQPKHITYMYLYICNFSLPVYVLIACEEDKHFGLLETTVPNESSGNGCSQL